MEKRLLREQIIVNGNIIEDINLNYNKTPEQKTIIGHINENPVYVKIPLHQQKKQKRKKITLKSKKNKKKKGYTRNRNNKLPNRNSNNRFPPY